MDSPVEGEEGVRESYYSAEATGKISEELALFSYKELCFAFDHLYGLKQQHDIRNFDDLAIATGARDVLTGTDARAIDEILYYIIYQDLDDLHSRYVSPSYLSGEGADEEFWDSVVGEGLSGDAHARLWDKYLDCRDIYYPDGIVGYEEVEDTAYITFDEFYTARDSYDRKLENNPYDTIEIICYAMSQILRDGSPVKNVVLDMSCNGGGQAAWAIDTLAAFLGDVEISLEDPNTGARVTNIYRADTNLDHVFDEKDTLAGKDLNLYCLTSPVSFSGGNLVPCVMKNSNEVTIIGQQSGGGACSVLYLTTASGSIIQISSSVRMSYLKNGSFYDIDQGAEVDYTIRDLNHFYNREKLTEFIDGLF